MEEKMEQKLQEKIQTLQGMKAQLETMKKHSLKNCGKRKAEEMISSYKLRYNQHNSSNRRENIGH